MSRHFRTLYRIKATFQPCSLEWKSADLEIRRKKRRLGTRPKRTRSTRYRRKYGLSMTEIIALLHTTHERVGEFDRNGTLKRIIRIRSLK